MGKSAAISGLLLAFISFAKAIPTGDSVATPPVIIENPPKTIIFKLGASTELPCLAVGDPEIKYSWLKNLQAFDPSETGGRIYVKPGEGTLVFNQNILDDEGSYQCLADNGLGVALTIRTQMTAAYLENFPMSPHRDHYPNLGAPLTLHCAQPASFPVPTISWFISRDYVPEIPVQISERVGIDPEGNLHIANVQHSDRHDYVCVLHNDVTETSEWGSNARLFPQGQEVQRHPPKSIWISPHYQVTLVGDTFRVHCCFSGMPTPSISWKRQGESMSERARVEDFGRELVIGNVQPSDGGKYECMGINEETTVPIRFSFDLVVEAAPSWGRKPENTEVYEGDNAVIECEADGIPEPIKSWSYNGNRMPIYPHWTIEPNKITIRSAIGHDTGVFQCNATNKHGYVFTNAYLNVLP